MRVACKTNMTPNGNLRQVGYLFDWANHLPLPYVHVLINEQQHYAYWKVDAYLFLCFPNAHLLSKTIFFVWRRISVYPCVCPTLGAKPGHFKKTLFSIEIHRRTGISSNWRASSGGQLHVQWCHREILSPSGLLWHHWRVAGKLVTGEYEMRVTQMPGAGLIGMFRSEIMKLGTDNKDALITHC